MTLTDRIDALRQRASDIASQLTALSDKRRSVKSADTFHLATPALIMALQDDPSRLPCQLLG